MTEIKENLLDWLRDAHAMEQQAEQMLKAQAGRIEHYPKLKARIEEHIQETVGQRERLSNASTAWVARPPFSRTRWARWPPWGRRLAA